MVRKARSTCKEIRHSAGNGLPTVVKVDAWCSWAFFPLFCLISSRTSRHGGVLLSGNHEFGYLIVTWLNEGAHMRYRNRHVGTLRPSSTLVLNIEDVISGFDCICNASGELSTESHSESISSERWHICLQPKQ